MERSLYLLSRILIFAGFIAFFNDAFAQNDGTSAWSGDTIRFGNSQDLQQLDLANRIRCAFEQNGLKRGKEPQWGRADYIARYLSNIMTRMVEPPWREPMTQHLVAQVVAETGTLKHLVELPSEYESSKMKHKGRGCMQTTHKENYAKLAACAEQAEQYQPPSQISWEQLSDVSPKNSSFLVKNPDQAMSEKTERGRFLNTMSCLCYFVDTAMRHDAFLKALKCKTDDCVREVGVAVNKGPGRLSEGAKPLAHEQRLKAFKKADSCFGTNKRIKVGS